MTDGEKPKIVSLGFDFRPEAAVSGALLVQTELEASGVQHSAQPRWALG
jgi:hypothetical protein